MYQIGWRAVVLGVLLAAVGPFTARVLFSPVVVILLSPLFLILFVVLLFTSSILLALILRYFQLSPQRPQANGLRTAARPLVFSTPAAWQALLVRSQWTTADLKGASGPILPDFPQISEALNELISYIIRDFVLVWYSKISPSPSFPAALDETIHSSLTVLASRVELLDLPSLVVHKILPKITSHVERFRQSEAALRGVGLERHLTQSVELDMLLASRYAGKDGKLHPAVANLASTVTKHTEQAHLRSLVDKVIPLIMPEKEVRSASVRIVAREIVACVVLSAVTEMVADPDFWNRMIDQAAGAAIRQQKLISKVRHILEAQSAGVTAPSAPTTAPGSGGKIETITSRTAARQFDSFIQSINRCNSLLDARRLKNDVVGEIRRTRILLANHENEELINGEKASDVVAYLDRLYNAKRHVEERIVSLGGVEEDIERRSIFHHPNNQSSNRVTLRDVLTNPNCLSYFMEFMDRREKSLPIQFWLTVETFKNPLENVDSDDSDGSSIDEEDVLGVPSLPSASATIRSDMVMVNELYFSNAATMARLPVISQKHIDAVRSYVAQDASAGPATALREKKVRTSVLLAQRQVERAMDEDFQDFQKSELWFKVLADLETAKTEEPPISPHAPQSASETSIDTPTQSIIHPAAQRSRTGIRPTFILPPKPPARSETVPLFMSQSTGSLPDPSSPMTASVASLPGAGPSRLSQTASSTGNLAFLTGSGPVEAARAPLFDDEQDGEEPPVQQETIDALQAALTDIIANEGTEDVRRKRRSMSFGSDPALSQTSSGTDVRKVLHTRQDSADFGYEEEEVHTPEQPEDAFHLAAPGDLQLSYEINRLTEKIDKVQAQETILDALIRKAELTGDAQELKVLGRSKSSIERELRELTFQRTQYEQQESENRLVPERTRITISNSGVAESPSIGTKQVVKYFLEVQQLASDGSFASGWVVARRYNEFWNLHQQLREKFVLVRSLEFPPKKLVTSLSSSFVDTRRVALERYMQQLIKVPLVCDSEELRSFLSRTTTAGPASEPLKPSASFSGLIPGQSIVKNMYKSVAESIDDMFFGPSMLDVMIQRLSKQAAEFAGIAGSGVHDEELIEQALKAKSRSFGGGGSRVEDSLSKLDLKPLEGESGMSSFSAPICDLILAVFELDKKNNWLRKQAVVIILQQVLGSTIERKVKELSGNYLDEIHILQYLGMFRDIMWPNGALKPPSEPRSAEEKIRTRDEANRKLSTLMPDLAANMIGRSNARRGARRMFAVLQNRRLNQHIIYSIIDEVFAALFPEANIL